ncbi:MAG: hypothetical protein IJI53_04925 [Clostridia bacterium]|nr:hypothetical protein [Clostridia bacterium]MBR0407359.1 hypothetical protein [Clostridia bacterium]
MKKTWLMLLCCAALLLTVPAWAEETAEERILAAQNDRLSLYLSANCCSIDIEDALTGKTWSSTMNDETAAGLKIIPAQQKRITSLLAVNCTNLQTGLGVVNNMALMAEKDLKASYDLIENGVRLSYYFGTYQVGVQVEIVLDGQSLVVRVPCAGIAEDGDFSIVSVDALPFLFSATDQSEGFFLYPDGCGAIMEFQDYAHYRESTKLYPVYGDYTKQPALLDMFAQEAPDVLFPVFGMNRGGHGMLAIIEQGAETARVSVNSSNNIIGINYLFANFQYRRSFDDKRVATRDIKVFDKDDIKTDYQLRILFLEEENPDYSVMACAWRDYLLQNGVVTKKESQPTVAIDLFMNAPEEGLLFDIPRTVTTLSQAEEILRSLDSLGVKNIRASLKGWTADGYGKTPDRFPLSGAIGNDNDLERLIDTAHSLGATVSLTANFLEAASDQRGYSHRNDVVYTGNHTIITDLEETVFMLSPDVANSKLNSFLEKANGFDLDAVRLERIGKYVAYNYSSRRYTTATQSLDIYGGMTDAVKTAFGSAEAEGGDTSLLGHADFFTDVPYDDAGYQFTTASVPFYQIALHGLVEYAGRPGNLSSDLEREVLRWVEMGYTPFFELTYDNTEELMYTNYQSLFSAEYTAWQERVAWAAKQFTEGPLAELHHQLIVEHRKLSDTLFKVTYENGTAVYVNYAAEPAQADGVEIAAQSWAAVPAQE